MSSFSKAFQEARKSGKGVFTWNGKDYSTRAKGEDFDEYRNKHADLDRWYGSSIYRSPNNGGWGDVSEDVFNKINHVPEPVTTPTAPTAPITPVSTRYDRFSDQDIKNLGFNNYQGLVAAANANSSNPFIKTLIGRFGDVSKWNQNKVESELGVHGRYHNFGGGDYGDMSRSMNSWISAQNGIADAQTDNNLQKYRDLANKKFTFTLNNPATGKSLTFKNGGMINYYQQGGAAEQDPQQQIIALVQAAMQGDQKATQQIKQIQVAAEQGDKSAIQIMQYIKQIMQQMQQQTQSAKRGAKLQYLAQLRGECPEGTHMEYFKAGGQICKKCMQNKVQEDKCGGKAKKQKMACGGATKTINSIKSEMEKCGGKMKKKK